MNDVYGRLSESGLLPRERDVVSGRLTARRDDKRRDDKSHKEPAKGSRSGTRTRLVRPTLTPRMGWTVGGAALLLVVAVTGAVAFTGRMPDPPTAVPGQGLLTAGVSSSLGGPVPAAASVSVPASSPASPTEAPASAIRLDYSGGKLVRNTCSDASGRGKCTLWEVQEGTLTVRCTPDGCTLYAFRETLPIDAPLSRSGDVPNKGKGCAPTHWTLKLSPVGEAVTEGITHPARLVGAATGNRPAALVPGFNCLGADQLYRYDATPS